MRSSIGGKRPSAAPFAALLAVGALALVACAPDGPDAYTAQVDDAPPATRAPSTSEPAELFSDDSADDSSGDSTPAESVPDETFPPNGETIVVLGFDNSFREEIIEVEAGTEVLWENRGRNDHNVLPVDETADWGVEVENFTPGDEYARVFDTPGEYPYYCSIHGTPEIGMIGTVVVTG